ncbi:MAG: tRNA (guanosine(46)-N7)-methyltransferase TrmB [Cyclobacteriaceae bacterium]|nr:tRNA (guanosine(46)-N7)-methyltransferase TrmB [Cyclobacteriaceae bacterium]
MRSKLHRFADLKARDNTIEIGKPIFEAIKGNWHKLQFKNNNPIAIELACGKGEYTIGLARQLSGTNFIGIDLKGERIWVGSSQAIEEKLNNVAFLRTHILELDKLFEAGEVSEVWLTFPDPRPKLRDEKRRLTHPRYLDIYKQILAPNGWFKFKTDNTKLFQYTLEVLAERNDITDLESTMNLYSSPLNAEHYGIQTRFEKKFNDAGENIKYLKFKFAH